MNNRKIIIFSPGDANKLKTWSNVPFFISHTLMNKGYEVICEDILLEDNGKELNFICRFINFIMKKLGGQYNNFSSSKIYNLYVNKVIRKTLEKNKDAFASIIFDYDHVLDDVKIAQILISDWDVEYAVKYYEGKKPTFFERKRILSQKRNIEKANAAITIFPNSYKEMKNRYSNIYFIPNGINAVISPDKFRSNIEKKYYSRHIVFVGKKYYLNGLNTLIKAVQKLNSFSNAKTKYIIDVIGLDKPEKNNKYINYYGYLDKSDERQCRTYYEVLSSSWAYINTTDNWVGASSIMEALYYHTPIIVSRNKELEYLFGKKLNCGYFVDHNNEEELSGCIDNLSKLSPLSYKSLQENGFKLVKKYTWENFCDKLINIIKRK